VAVPARRSAKSESLTVRLRRVSALQLRARKRALARTLFALPASPSGHAVVTCATPRRVRPQGEPHFITHFAMTFQLLLHAVPATSLPVSAIPWAATSRLTLACSPCAFRVHYPVTSIILTLHAALATVAARLLRGHASAAFSGGP